VFALEHKKRLYQKERTPKKGLYHKKELNPKRKDEKRGGCNLEGVYDVVLSENQNVGIDRE